MEDHGEWDEIIWNPECPVVGHSDFVLSVDFSPNGKQIVSESDDNLVMICNAETGAEVSSFGGVRLGWRGGVFFFRAFPAFFCIERGQSWRMAGGAVPPF